MNMHLLNDALQLSAKDRLELIEKLWDSLSHSELPLTADERTFLDKRIADMETNPTEHSNWADARSRLIKRNP